MIDIDLLTTIVCEGVCSANQHSGEETELMEERLNVGDNNSDTANTSSSVLPGFGSANFFKPLPSDGTVVAALCNWELRYNFVENRIPRRFLHFIQEILKPLPSQRPSLRSCVLTRAIPVETVATSPADRSSPKCRSVKRL